MLCLWASPPPKKKSNRRVATDTYGGEKEILHTVSGGFRPPVGESFSGVSLPSPPPIWAYWIIELRDACTGVSYALTRVEFVVRAESRMEEK